MTDKPELQPDAQRQVFAKNLQALCNQLPSISEASRQLDINRTQLNRYLEGESWPRPDVLGRICAFFDVDANILLHPLSVPADSPAPAVEVKTEAVEQIARHVYDAMLWASHEAPPRNGMTPPWVEGGNSHAQTEARAAAHSILSAFSPQPPQVTPEQAVKATLRNLAVKIAMEGHINNDLSDKAIAHNVGVDTALSYIHEAIRAIAGGDA